MRIASFRRIMLFAPVAFVTVAGAPTAILAQGAPVPNAEWEVPWGAAGRPRDPYVSPDGFTYFVGQTGNYIARLDPRTGEFKRFEVDPGTNPHNLIVDPVGNVWYSGNRNAMIGKLDPRTGAITRYPMPDPRVRDPHTMIFDAKGDIWFTAQQSNFVGHLNVQTGDIRVVNTGDGTKPYGIVINSKGIPWFNLFGTNKIAHIDPATMVVTTIDLPDARARGRRIAVTSDDVIWYTDYTRGFLGRVDPRTNQVTEIPMPAGSGSLPYGMASDDKGRIWVTEGVPNKGSRLLGYDPASKTWFASTPIGRPENNVIRHMFFDKKTGLLWFGTDQGTIGRAEVSRVRTAM
jgi:virginiamycin B lyase